MLTREELQKRAVKLTEFIEALGDTCGIDELHDFTLNNYSKVEPYFVLPEPPRVITVVSTHGIITADKDGKVIEVLSYIGSRSPATWELLAIDRLDVVEWQYSYPFDDITDGELDILDIGYWNKDGSYERPCYSWREEREQALLEDSLF